MWELERCIIAKFLRLMEIEKNVYSFGKYANSIRKIKSIVEKSVQ